MEHFYLNKNGTFNANDLCSLDISSIKTLIDKGYSLGEIQDMALRFFKSDKNKKRYDTLRKFIENFESNNK